MENYLSRQEEEELNRLMHIETIGVPDDEIEDEDLSDKPWKDKRKKSKSKRRRTDDWEEMQSARARWLREHEEDLRRAQELADEGM